ncbi:MAG: hypothetical protein WBW93_06025 [Steroidobacteraceae bacterium]
MSAKPQAERATHAETFEEIAREWLELQSKPLAVETMEILGTRLKSLLYPYVGSRPVASITAQELLAALRRIEARGKHETAHRVRALSSRATSPRSQLAHSERNKVRAAYNKAQRLSERKKMMQAWADYLDGLKAGEGGKVVPIHRTEPAA